MKKITIPVSATLILILTASKPVIDCQCNYLGEADHKRTKVKDRLPGENSQGTSISVSKIVSMGITRNEYEDIKANDDATIARENKIVTVSGYAWIVKLSSEDCDIHLEISQTNDVEAQRIVAEIPNTSSYCALRKQILSQLTKKYDLHQKKEYRFDKTDNGGNPVLVTITGYLFWDSGHPTNYNHGSKLVGSVWEIHPVYKLKWD